MTKIRYLSLVVTLFLLCGTVSGQTDFNPANPAEPVSPVVPAAKYGLVLKASPAEGGSPSGGGSYAAGTSVTVNARTNSGYTFLNWTDTHGNTVSSASSFSYTTEARPDTLIANYTFVPGSPGEPSQPDVYYNLVLEATEGGTVSGGGRYLSGNRIYLRATANDQYSFRNWVSKSGDVVSTSANFYYTTQAKDDTLRAVFSLIPFNPSSPGEPSPAQRSHRVSASCSTGGTYSGNTGTFTEGAAVSLRATANTGYRFVGWYIDGELFATSTQLSYTVGTSDVDIYALFEFAPSSPGEPSAPAKENSLYLMTINGLPGQERQFPVYLSNQDTLTDMTFQLTFAKGAMPDLDNYIVSQKAADYEVSCTVIDDSICKFVFTGGIMLPGNTPLLTLNIPIEEETELGSAFQIKMNQVSVSDASGTSMAASTHNGILRVGRSSWLKLTLDDLTGSESVNLGLSVKWASKNVGTTSPEELGDYHRWEDVAHSPSSVFGSGWRMPTADEVAELLTCYKLWTTLEDVPGMLFISQNAEDLIFLPAAGRQNVSDSSANEVGTLGQYWSSTATDNGNAYTLLFGEYGSELAPADINGLRLSLRAVYDKEYLEGDFSSQEVENPEPGTLEEETVKPDDVVDLKVRGRLNGTDIAFIRSLKKLRKLDISEAYIVEGGSAYYASFHTANDATGDSMFCKLPNLRELRLCTSIKEIGKGMLAHSTGISTFDVPASVEKAGNHIFAGCDGLRYVNWLATAARVPADLFGSMATNCLVYAAEGTASDFTGNIVIGGTAENISLIDALPFFCPIEFRTKAASYSRTFGKTTVPHVACGWETVVLPFDVERIVSEERGELAPFNCGNAGTRPFWLAELSENGFSPASSISANQPYIIAMPNSDEYEEEFNIRGTVTFSASDAANGIVIAATPSDHTSKGPDYELIPTYETVLCHDTVYVINHEDYDGLLPGAAFVRGIRNAQPFEVYAHNIEPSVNTPLYYSIGPIKDATGIEQVLYRQIFNGLKAYSRDGALCVESPHRQTIGLYSADGRLVRLMRLSEGLNSEYGLPSGIYFIGKMKVAVQ
ncbi:MAG: leucine-rich repeat protein [Bacteroides sp.]|nr:leucine-rich repeat protein [Roseburia sp.]MCM1346119.1 leucine-rich repeat protein [Bacteroides sp.]MCM1421186.1 leucine-rich repeat protein [Bacteroides sp.]